MYTRFARLSAFLLALALIATACGSARSAPGWTIAPGTTEASPAPSALPTAAPSADGASAGVVAGETRTIDFVAVDLAFEPQMVMVQAPGTYTVNLTNNGSIGHDMTFDDGTKIAADAGKTATGTVAIPAGGMNFICSVPGHAAAGMTGMVMVDGGSAGGGQAPEPSIVAGSPMPSMASGGDGHGGSLPTVPGVLPDANAPPSVLYDATAPALLAGRVHDIDLTITEGMMTVAPGYVVDAWTFGGTVPGPVIRVKVGDTVRVHLKNPATNTMAHSVDFHASQVAWNDEMTSIQPGEEKLYEFTADYAGVWMYHCGTAPALEHIANGMYGMLIVEPRAGLPKVDHEFALVQSEWYIDGQGVPVSYEKAAAPAPAPDFVVFNGVANQYKDHPLEVGTGQTVRFFLLDAGPDIDSSFHIVGTIFNSVIKEGVQLSPGNAGNWGSQAVDLSPAQGAIVQLTPAEDGLYPISPMHSTSSAAAHLGCCRRATATRRTDRAWETSP